MKTVVYGATRNIYKQALVCINSCIKNGNIDRVVLLAEDPEIKLPKKFPDFEIIDVSNQRYFDFNSQNALRHWTWMVLMKAALSKVFTDEDVVLWLDCDTLVFKDISNLWDLDLNDYYYAMVKQFSDGRKGTFHRGDYFNAGVMMCNLKKLRKDQKDDEIIDYLNTRSYDFPEQDCINKLCEGKIKPLPGRYNTCDFNVPDDDIYIRHYAADGSWINGTLYRLYEVEDI